jgi:hypothetical protein
VLKLKEVHKLSSCNMCSKNFQMNFMCLAFLWSVFYSINACKSIQITCIFFLFWSTGIIVVWNRFPEIKLKFVTLGLQKIIPLKTRLQAAHKNHCLQLPCICECSYIKTLSNNLLFSGRWNSPVHTFLNSTMQSHNTINGQSGCFNFY